MPQNRTLRLLYSTLSLLGLGGILSAFLGGPAPLTAGCILAILLVTARYLHSRNREIRGFSDYLLRVTNGAAPEIRDNEEGELSVLKSEIYKVTHTLYTKAEDLKEQRQFLAASISDISHQLKTPITSISLLTDLITDGDMPPEKRAEFIGNIRSELDRVSWLVQSLLKLARLDAAAVEFELASVPLYDLVRQAAEPLSILIELKDLSFSILGDPSLTLLCDRSWLVEAVQNVLKNCVEHTPPGGALTATLTANTLFTGLIVRDTGPGIPQEDLPHIFQRFYRGKYTAADSVGIGLSLAASIVSNLGGTLEAGNEKAGGARFTFRFYRGA